MIAAHFDHMRSVLGRNLDALAADYVQASRVLAVRLMPDKSDGGPDLPHAAVRPVAPGIVAVLVFDFPDSTATVDREQIDEWPVDIDGAFAEGMSILDREPKPLRDDVEDGNVRFTIWYGDSFYVATWLMRLEELLPPGTADAIVGVPNRHMLVVHPIIDSGAIDSLSSMQQLALDGFREGPGSISGRLYWWSRGDLTVIAQTTVGRELHLRVPPELEAVLDQSTGLRNPAD